MTGKILWTDMVCPVDGGNKTQFSSAYGDIKLGLVEGIIFKMFYFTMKLEGTNEKKHLSLSGYKLVID
jgi:hypothetical protein